MTCAATAMIRIARAAGIDVFVIPRRGRATGQAFADRKRFINIHGFGREIDVARVAAHELAHHMLQHTTHWRSCPAWRIEMEAELLAIELLRDLVDAEDLAILQSSARDHLRPMLQSFLDEGIVNHGEVAAAEWAGCHISPEVRALDAGFALTESDPAEVPF